MDYKFAQEFHMHVRVAEAIGNSGEHPSSIQKTNLTLQCGASYCCLYIPPNSPARKPATWKLRGGCLYSQPKRTNEKTLINFNCCHQGEKSWGTQKAHNPYNLSASFVPCCCCIDALM